MPQLYWPQLITEADFSFDGIPWSNPEIWFPNIAGIIILFIYRTGSYKKLNLFKNSS